MKTALLLIGLGAAFLALGEISKTSATCRTVVRFGRGGKWSTIEGACFAWLTRDLAR